MIGVYEHRRWFHRRYENAFEVKKEGILYNQHFYAWVDIQDIRRYKSSGAAGYGVVIFTDDVKCVVNLRTFRKKDDDSRISLFGDNATFSKLIRYWYGQKLQSLKDPKMLLIESKIEELMGELDSTNEEKEISRIEKEFKEASREHIKLINLYHNKLDEEHKRLRRKSTMHMVLIASSLFILGLLILWNP